MKESKAKYGLNWILGWSRPRKRLVALAVDTVFLLLAMWAAFALRLENKGWLPSDAQVVLFGSTLVFTLVVFVKLGLYRAVIRYISERALLAIIAGIGLSALFLIVFGFLLQAFVPRSVPVLYGAFAFFFVAGTRFAVRAVVNFPASKSKMPVLIVGTGETGLQLASALSKGMEYKPVAFIALEDAQHRSNIGGMPVYGRKHLVRAVREHMGARVLLALDERDLDQRKSLLSELEGLNVEVQTVPSMSELVAGQARINDIRDLDIEDLLGRDPVRPDSAIVAGSLYKKAVLVTGAGGSIGSELCRQIIRHRPKSLTLFEQSEYSLYAIERELQSINQIEGLGVSLHAVLGSVTHRRRCEAVMRAFAIQTVYHAAAYKHVPLVEQNIIEGVQNNVFGTAHTAEAAISAGVERFVLISTDKAVRPTNVMGASKRMAELVLQGLAARQTKTIFSMVRFGNVLGSSGSVVPLFRDQIRDGGPVTVTHPDIIRYFMTIPEASQLVLQAGSMGRGGEVFVLDMGDPVRIADLAHKMIHLMGMVAKTPDRPDGEIEIVYTGLRPGEKLYEELLIGDDPQGTAHPRIMMARESAMKWDDVNQALQELRRASQEFDCEAVVQILKNAPTGFAPNGDVSDLVWCRGEQAPSLTPTDSDNVRQFPA